MNEKIPTIGLTFSGAVRKIVKENIPIESIKVIFPHFDLRSNDLSEVIKQYCLPGGYWDNIVDRARIVAFELIERGLLKNKIMNGKIVFSRTGVLISENEEKNVTWSYLV